MQYLKKELAVQSYCLRNFQPLGIPAVAKKLLETGMTYIGIGTPEKKRTSSPSSNSMRISA